MRIVHEIGQPAYIVEGPYYRRRVSTGTVEKITATGQITVRTDRGTRRFNKSCQELSPLGMHGQLIDRESYDRISAEVIVEHTRRDANAALQFISGLTVQRNTKADILGALDKARAVIEALDEPGATK